MMEELHQIWPSASNLCNITRREIYIWFKYLTSLLQVNCEHYSDHWGVEGTWHALYSWTSSWIHVKWQNVDRNLKRKSVLLWRCCSVSCSLEIQICSQSFSDKHTAAWWIYWSLLEYKLTEKNDKFQFLLTRQCKWKIVRHKGLLTTASHVKKVLKWLESFFLSLSLFWTPIHFFTPDMMFLLGECVEKINCVHQFFVPVWSPDKCWHSDTLCFGFFLQ